MSVRPAAPRAFSLIELIVTVAIIGILAAIAVPRLSQGAERAAPEATGGDLAILQKQIELYAAEHAGVYPAYNGDGTNASHTEAAFLSQMTSCSSVVGRVSATPSGTFRFGPYLRQGLPALKVGPKAGLDTVLVLTGGAGLTYRAGEEVGWLYNDTTGQIEANAPDAVKTWEVLGGVPAEAAEASLGP